MKFTAIPQKVQEILRQRNFAVVVAGVLLFTNCGLVIGLLSKTEKTILVPMYNIANPMEINGKSFSKNYLTKWAGALLSDLLAVTPFNVKRKNRAFLQHCAYLGELAEDLKKNAARIQKDQLSTVFYPKEFRVNQRQQEVAVKGIFYAWVGRDKKPVFYSKTYILTYKFLANGMLAVTQLKEKNHAK